MHLSLFHHAFFISGETLFEALARLVFHVYIFPKCHGFHKHKYDFLVAPIKPMQWFNIKET